MGWQSILSIFKDKRELLDPHRFDDEIAPRVDWTPLVGGGSSFCTHRPQTKQTLTTSTLTFKTTATAFLFCGMFVCLGLAWIIGFAIPHAAAGGGMDGGASLIPIGFVLFGWWYAWHLRRKEITFDRDGGLATSADIRLSLSNLHAIQLIREHVRGSKNSYYSYELNLITKDLNRWNVTDHGNLRAIRMDAQVLGDYLGIPVWDAIDFRIPDASSGEFLKATTLNQNR